MVGARHQEPHARRDRAEAADDQPLRAERVQHRVALERARIIVAVVVGVLADLDLGPGPAAAKTRPVPAPRSDGWWSDPARARDAGRCSSEESSRAARRTCGRRAAGGPRGCPVEGRVQGWSLMLRGSVRGSLHHMPDPHRLLLDLRWDGDLPAGRVAPAVAVPSPAGLAPPSSGRRAVRRRSHAPDPPPPHPRRGSPRRTRDRPSCSRASTRCTARARARSPRLRRDARLLPGSFTAVMGPSGSGKSTLLHVRGGARPADPGAVAGGVSSAGSARPSSPLRRERDRLRLPGLQPDAVADRRAEHRLPLRLGRPPAGRAGARDRRRASAWATASPPAPQLSGGQQQRVAIARALVTRPEVVFADEPTGALDTATGREVLALLRESSTTTGQTVVMVTHDPVAAAYADRVVFLADGQVAGDARGAHADDGRRPHDAPGGLTGAPRRPPGPPRP